jgi:DHA2 family multidrug resistance protein
MASHGRESLAVRRGFVCAVALALSNLRGRDIPQGAGLTNMMRQLGGSFGIALIATYIQHRSASHRQNLLAHVSVYDATLRERMQGIVQSLVGKGSTLYEAQRQASAAIEGIVARQTFLLTYMDAFRIVGVFFLACIPLLLLFKRGRRPGPISTAMH